jgi:hypothetical protein
MARNSTDEILYDGSGDRATLLMSLIGLLVLSPTLSSSRTIEALAQDEEPQSPGDNRHFSDGYTCTGITYSR